MVRVSWFEEKSREQKARIAAEITDSLVRNAGANPKPTFVIFEDVKPGDWPADGSLFGQPQPDPK